MEQLLRQLCEVRLKTKKPILSSGQGTDAQGSGTFSGENGGMIKAYGNYFDKTIANFKYYTQNNPASTGYDAYETASRDEKVPETEVTKKGGTAYNNFDTDASVMYTYNPVAATDVPALVTGYYGAGRLNHGDFTYTFPDNVGNDDTDSAYDTTLASMLDNYQSSFVGFFDGETTGINAINGEGFTVNGSVYNLAGQRVANGQKPTAKGLYIINGKKVAIK